MSQELLRRAHEIIGSARKRGAQDVRAYIQRYRDSRAEWRDGQLDRVRESTTMSLDLELYVDGRYSTNSTSDLRPDALGQFLDETVAMTRLLAPDPHRRLPDPSRYQGRFEGDLQAHDPRGVASLTGSERRRCARVLEEAVRSGTGAERIVTVSTSSADAEGSWVLATSNGMEGSTRFSNFVLSAEVTVQDEGDRRQRGASFCVTTQRDQLESFDAIGRDALQRALQGVGARPEPTGRYACIIENRYVRRVLGGLLRPLSGRLLQQERSFLKDKIGEQITNPILSITDDPHVVGSYASRTFDDEGMATHPRPIFERGQLRNYYLSTYYASKLGLEPTTAGRTNLVFKPGTRDLTELLRAMGTGLLVTDFSGGNSNAATGDFSVGIRGHWVENGRIVRPVTEMNMAGNHLEFWNNLVELGSDVYSYSTYRSPSFRFVDVQFSGT